jgi:hypothetical protein
MSASQSPIKILPPVLFDENGDVQAFSSVEELAGYIEAVDVLNDEYDFYDSTGRVLEARVRKGKVHLTPTARSASGSDVLRRRMIRVLASLGVSEEDVADLSFTEMSHLLLENSHKKRA